MSDAIGRIERGKVLHEPGLVELGAPRQHGGSEGDAHASAQVPEEIVQRARLGHPLPRDVGERQGGEGDEGHAHAEARATRGQTKVQKSVVRLNRDII